MQVNSLHSPFNDGSCCSSTSCELRYRDEPWDFLPFFLSERLAKGSIRSTNVPDDIVTLLLLLWLCLVVVVALFYFYFFFCFLDVVDKGKGNGFFYIRLMFRSDTNSNKRLLFGRVNLHTLMHARKTSHKHPQKNTHTRTHTSLYECAGFSIFFCACVRHLSKWFPPDFLTLSVLIFANFTWVILQWCFFFFYAHCYHFCFSLRYCEWWISAYSALTLICFIYLSNIFSIWYIHGVTFHSMHLFHLLTHAEKETQK